ncbi:1,2-phenylacetyl-CoA epoxidase subunit PaaD [Dactylosporangium sp. AC04546]|uniref:1,2-phenylacetyl-CoA epoxidase subunit PaaD n=1 Tax=Dactylosporangium sp. AC04546 TaxID=2862460 RepID=UPI001EDD4159|nr:1,2-phenylacetyl-CoA epoxidase subunit PaaD [Dactylosporangium sp. AC04546]WVK84049.1 1,2-phenylacetyl-CoA epoxidase subunit PaaD [Dactylosporangium sp. AC04546]
MVTAAELVRAVPDPELRVVTIGDLGIVRSVDTSDSHVTVTITPTYSGCPAMDAIRADISAALREAGFSDISVETVLAPAWSTDWITDAGRSKLAAAGIAPPGRTVALALTVRCPRCGSPDTEELSRFGSTACKSLWRCRSCSEPFDAVKTL